MVSEDDKAVELFVPFCLEEGRHNPVVAASDRFHSGRTEHDDNMALWQGVYLFLEALLACANLDGCGIAVVWWSAQHGISTVDFFPPQSNLFKGIIEQAPAWPGERF